jgi:hypothetical protein
VRQLGEPVNFQNRPVAKGPAMNFQRSADDHFEDAQNLEEIDLDMRSDEVRVTNKKP